MLSAEVNLVGAAAADDDGVPLAACINSLFMDYSFSEGKSGVHL